MQGVGFVTYRLTGLEWITRQSRWTNAVGAVILRMADSTQATCTWTGIAASEIQAVFVEGTVGIAAALGATGWWRAQIARQTVTNRLLAMWATLSIGTAG